MDGAPMSDLPTPIETGPGQASGKEDEGRDELAPGSPSLSPASSDHRPTPSEPVKRKRGRPAKSKTASTPPAKRAAVQAEPTNAEASGSQLAPEPSSERPTRSRPVRARKATTYTEQSSDEEDELDPQPPTSTPNPARNVDDADARSPSTGPEDILPYEADGSYTPLKSPKPHNPNPTGRKRGRPPGSKNKNPRPPKELEEGKLPRVKRPPKLDADGNPVPKKARKPGSGRPKGSKNKATLLKEAEQRRKEEEDNGGPLPQNNDNDNLSPAFNLHDAPPPGASHPDVDAGLPLQPDAAALHLAHAALLQGLPPNALDLDHHQQQHPYDDGQMGGDVQGYPDELQFEQAEAIQVALQQQMLLRKEEEERAQGGGI